MNITRNMLAIGEAMIEIAPLSGGQYRRSFAGDTFNTAWHLAQLLGPRAEVGFFTRIGQDKLSDQFMAELQADGINTKGIGRDAERIMGLYLIELDGVERSFHYWRNNSAARLLAENRGELEAAVQTAGLIHLSGITLAILSAKARSTLFDVLAQARRDGAMISFDPNIRPKLWSSREEMRTTINSMLGITDIALPSFDDEAANFNDTSASDTIARMSAFGVKEIIVKDGAASVKFCSEGLVDEMPTPVVDDIVDTTGAGDAFNAGYLAARMMGVEMPAAIKSGQMLSAEILRHPGARAPKSAIAAMPAIEM